MSKLVKTRTTNIPNDRLILVYQCAACRQMSEVKGSDVEGHHQFLCHRPSCDGFLNFVQAKLVLAGEGPVVKLKPLKGKKK